MFFGKGGNYRKASCRNIKRAGGMEQNYNVYSYKKCIDKGVIQRKEPNFVCCPLVTKDQVREFETKELINKMYDGSTDHLVAALLGNKNITPEEIGRIKQLIRNLN